MKIGFCRNPEAIRRAWVDRAEKLDETIRVEIPDAELPADLRARYGGPTDGSIEWLTPTQGTIGEERKYKHIEAWAAGALFRVPVAVPLLNGSPTTAEAISLLRDYLVAREEAQHILDALCAEKEAEVAERIRQREEETAAARKQKEAARAAYDAERETWIAAHGSPRLKRMLAESVGLDRTYRTERLAAERPDWIFYDDICGEEKGIRDPSEATLAALDAARQVAPDARLGWLAAGEHICEDADECGFRAGPVAVAEILGRTIILRLEA